MAEQWEDFQNKKKLSATIKREMKYKLLPKSFHDQFDNLEEDYTKMSSSKFLAEAQKCETVDVKERLKQKTGLKSSSARGMMEIAVAILTFSRRIKSIQKKAQVQTQNNPEW